MTGRVRSSGAGGDGCALVSSAQTGRELMYVKRLVATVARVLPLRHGGHDGRRQVNQLARQSNPLFRDVKELSSMN